jgi:hypothetical protein
MDNPLVKKDLLDSILQLREEVDRELKANKYYVALQKLDELLAAIRPLGTIEDTVSANQRAEAPIVAETPAAEASSEPEPAAAETEIAKPAEQASAQEERVWSGVVGQAVVDQGWQPPATETPAEQRPS